MGRPTHPHAASRDGLRRVRSGGPAGVRRPGRAGRRAPRRRPGRPAAGRWSAAACATRVKAAFCGAGGTGGRPRAEQLLDVVRPARGRRGRCRCSRRWSAFSPSCGREEDVVPAGVRGAEPAGPLRGVRDDLHRLRRGRRPCRRARTSTSYVVVAPRCRRLRRRGRVGHGPGEDVVGLLADLVGQLRGGGGRGSGPSTARTDTARRAAGPGRPCVRRRSQGGEHAPIKQITGRRHQPAPARRRRRRGRARRGRRPR